jgi:hypothetical protein
VCTPTGLPVTFALDHPKLDEREVARDLFESEPGLLRRGQTILADQGYASKEFETYLTERGVTLFRPATAREHDRTTTPLLKPLRQLIESVNATLKTRATEDGPLVGLTRVLERLLTLTAAIWHNHNDRPEEAALPRRLRPRVTPRN